jgi:hypothetical protein
MKALVALGRLKLVGLSGTDLSDERLAQLLDLDGLEAIDLRGTKVATDGVQRLQRELPGCKCFSDPRCDCL